MEETLTALKEMGSWKAPDPDGYQPGFFKRSWATTGSSVHKFVQEALEGKEIPEETTGALLVLVPKEVKPSSLRNFRLISLCNMNIKLVTKVIANQLKLILKDLVASNQSSFILGR